MIVQNYLLYKKDTGYKYNISASVTLYLGNIYYLILFEIRAFNNKNRAKNVFEDSTRVCLLLWHYIFTSTHILCLHICENLRQGRLHTYLTPLPTSY
jgi:hypothetical protein